MKGIFIGMDEVKDLLDISQASAYRLISSMNEEMAKAGYLVIRGKANRKYLEDKMFGVKGSEAFMGMLKSQVETRSEIVQ